MRQRVKLSDISLGARPRDSLVAEEDVKKKTKTKSLSGLKVSLFVSLCLSYLPLHFDCRFKGE